MKQMLLFVTFKSPLKDLDHQLWLTLFVATYSTDTSNIE